MTALVAVGSARGAPGVTTVSMLLAGCMTGEVVVAEADLDGGVLAARHGLGRQPGLTTLAAESPSPDVWRAHAQLAGGVPVLVGPDVPERAVGLWARAGNGLAEVLAASSARVIVDVGRVRPGEQTPLLSAASLVVLLVRPVTEELVTLAHRLPVLEEATSAGVLVAVVGSGRYGAEDVAGQLGADVVAVLPVDDRAGAILKRGGSTRALARTGLARAVRGLADEVVGRLAVPTPSGGRALPSATGRQLSP